MTPLHFLNLELYSEKTGIKKSIHTVQKQVFSEESQQGFSQKNQKLSIPCMVQVFIDINQP